MRWKINESDAGSRLDLFLTEKRKGETRSQIQKRIKEGVVLVNKKPATVHRFLKEGDAVEWVDARARVVPPKPLNTWKRAPAPIIKPTIIAETSDWLVIDKPAGLLVHPDAKTESGTLVDWLLEYDPKIAKVGEHPGRPGIVHRLDREVSGLMVIAKTQAAFDSLKAQIAGRTVHKHYLAMVHGEPSQDEGEIKFRIARSSTQPRMAARPVKQEEGKAAWTHYKVQRRFTGAALLDLEIFSGRTHQIRAHLHALGHPVMGDALYTHKKTPRNTLAPRLMLQSVALSFDDPKTGKSQSFTLEPVPAFAELADRLS